MLSLECHRTAAGTGAATCTLKCSQTRTAVKIRQYPGVRCTQDSSIPYRLGLIARRPRVLQKRLERRRKVARQTIHLKPRHKPGVKVPDVAVAEELEQRRRDGARPRFKLQILPVQLLVVLGPRVDDGKHLTQGRLGARGRRVP